MFDLHSAEPEAVIAQEFLEDQAVAVVSEAHKDLLTAFVGSGSSRPVQQIRLFRQDLAKLAKFAERRQSRRLMTRAAWLEWYWFQREYADTKFDDKREESCLNYSETALDVGIRAKIVVARCLIVSPAELARIIHIWSSLEDRGDRSFSGEITAASLADAIRGLDLRAQKYITWAFQESLVQIRTPVLNMKFLEVIKRRPFEFRFEFLEDFQGVTIINSQRSFRRSIVGRLRKSIMAYMIDTIVAVETEISMQDFKRGLVNPT